MTHFFFLRIPTQQVLGITSYQRQISCVICLKHFCPGNDFFRCTVIWEHQEINTSIFPNNPRGLFCRFQSCSWENLVFSILSMQIFSLSNLQLEVMLLAKYQLTWIRSEVHLHNILCRRRLISKHCCSTRCKQIYVKRKQCSCVASSFLGDVFMFSDSQHE